MPLQETPIKPTYLRILGILGMAGAPWMLIDFIENGLYDRFKDTVSSGVHNLLFITGCMCSVLGLYFLKATGVSKTGRIIIMVQLLLLAIANGWNVYEIFYPDSSSRFYHLLGNFWPAGCLFLIVTGIFVLRARRVTGWRAKLPLLAGLWFPFMALLSVFFRESLPMLVLSGIYAAVIYMAFGFSLVTLPDAHLKK